MTNWWCSLCCRFLAILQCKIRSNPLSVDTTYSDIINQNQLFQHKKTTRKLQDLMKQAESEANKAVGGNEMVKNNFYVFFQQIEFQLTLRIKSLKNQLDISESELDLAQTDKRKIQDENLAKEKEIQVNRIEHTFSNL